MRILLVYPDTDPLSVIPRGLINIEPLGLEYLAGALNNHDVSILDMKMEKGWQRVIERLQPDLVGITGTVVHTRRMIEVLDYAKRVNPTCVTVAGGPHATLVPHDFEVPQVDVLVSGQRPDSFRQLVEAVETRRPLDDIEGLRYRNHNRWHATSIGQPAANLDHLPMPRRDLTARNRHRYCHLVWKPVALMVTSVGCPHACSFCPCPALTGHRVLRRAPELVLQELLKINEPYVYIGDDNLFFDRQHAGRIAELVKQAGLKKQFYVLSRVDDINKHPDLIERWAESGLKKVFLGLESPDDSEIKALNKRGSVSENSRAVEILHANGVDPLGAFIIRPEYTRDDFDRVLAYMDRMRIYYFEFTVLTPFPGTEFYEQVKGDILSHDTRLFDLAHSLFPTRLPLHEFYSEYSRLHRRAASPFRALRLKPVNSPFRRMAYFRQSPQLVGLFFSAKRAYRELQKAY
ncbi:MAG: radical SAM protein [Candidatus Zixiibacteriota bacterium]